VAEQVTSGGKWFSATVSAGDLVDIMARNTTMQVKTAIGMVYMQFCVSIAAGKTEKRNSVSTSTLFTTARTLPTLPTDGTYATVAADVTYRCYLPTARAARALPTDVTYQRYLRCVVLETRHYAVRHTHFHDVTHGTHIFPFLQIRCRAEIS